MTHRIDVAPPEADLLYGTTVRSTVLAGRIRAVHWHGVCDWQNVVTFEHRDLRPNERVLEFLGGQPLLVEENIRHLGEPILLLAAPTPDLRDRAASSVTVEGEVHEPVLTIEKALAAFQVLHADDNVYERFDFQRGDPQQGLAEADFVREDKFRVGGLESLRLRPQAATAIPTPGGGLRIAGSCAPPDLIHRMICMLFALRGDQVEIIDENADTTDAAHAEFWPLLPVHAALLARKAGRPVRLDYARQEDMLAMARRHPGIIRHRSGFRADGTLVGRDMLVFLDGGAYCGTSRDALVRALLHASGPYRCPHVRVRGRVIATHTPANGSPLGDGVLQVTAGGELHLDRAAIGLGIAPHELRRRNVWQGGDDPAGAGPPLRGGIGGDEVLEHLMARTGFAERWRELAIPASPGEEKSDPLRGIGLAMSMFGCGLDHGLAEQAGRLLRGEIQPEYSCGAHVVEVEVERETGELRIVRLAAAAGTGSLDPPEKARRIFESGCLRSLEFGFRREQRGEDGTTIVEAADMARPDALEVELLPGRTTAGRCRIGDIPAWAQGGTPAALISAVGQALQSELDSMPLTPQSILAALDLSWRPWRALNRDGEI